MAEDRLVLAHVPDAAWIIALWKYIHGGDPPPSDRVAAANIVAALAPILAGEPAAPLSIERLQQRFAEIGTEITVEPVERARAEAARAEEALRPVPVPDWESIEVCYGRPPNRHCVSVLVPRLRASDE